MLKKMLLMLLFVSAGFALGLLTPFIQNSLVGEDGELLVPTIITPTLPKKELPLQKYSLTKLADLPRSTAPIQIVKELEATSSYTSYLFTWTTQGKIMTGQVNLPRPFDPENATTIVLLRGYVPEDSYETGVGTKNAAAIFAQQGYMTVAPDFFGYGGSDPEPTDTWQARFEKPLLVMELLDSLKIAGIQGDGTPPILSKNIGIWAHSNGGQIALSTLEAFQLTIPTTLWAPVSAPFPYSIQFFSDEIEDEGKSQRKWISLFEDDYDVFDYSVTQHLDMLKAPLQLHHGETDDAAPIAWSDEFVEKLEAAQVATAAATQTPYPITYYRYKGTDHNMQPKTSWNTAIQRDLTFFAKTLAE
ncbi:MAG: prolyl oligopeptidase family serine peptidase [Candidatus Pacebacteria bacterium]|nr:prolyl oligopeptidase family serine peptidase [Candidatus Paceibacterota bacterium]PIR63192.1 MAG: hypothetical protein COU64_05750 [Candidatus Pacebacteria bacterium CG10_big_fil_rev_8_21_14_0_10_40_26]PIZ78222.1 MAG: hypothetical protein COY01_05570 [Candidatus Pacebacteria bacterium CG_4_10_14_0_2_um_filter_40_20]PJA68733.1 MAG: hypothetical protein CO156_04475 [Candidatus Pacebacteria bacterium CG_4_9_14_3_um_filter_40_12]PJC41673.1 MAG: hypothetical protein CO041_03065 [Candidatus Paceb